MDACDRLWVLDTGTIGIGETTMQACPYTLNVFDLTTDKVLRQYTLRPEDINQVQRPLLHLNFAHLLRIALLIFPSLIIGHKVFSSLSVI